MRILGVGGTGVVTVAQILATAAVIDGKFVRSLDQTGLAQKGGAVVSDLKISNQLSPQAAKIGQGRCSLYLACDSLVGTDPNNLKVADAATTVAVVSTTEIPTGKMVVDTSVHFPELSEILCPTWCADTRRSRPATSMPITERGRDCSRPTRKRKRLFPWPADITPARRGQ
jgi:indolepyruvate ferredoxin oxidoreductase